LRKKTLLFNIFLILSFSLFGSDWSRGIELEKSEDKSSAIHFYQEWLNDNETDAEYYKVLMRFLALQKDDDSFLEEAKKEWNLEPAESADLQMLIGSVLEIRGRIEEASEWFMKSYETFPVVENIYSLISASELEIRMGKYIEADKILIFLNSQELPYNIKEKIGLLLSRSKYQQGDLESSIDYIRSILSMAGERSLEFLVWSSDLTEKAGEDDLLPGFKEELSLRFPKVSEYLEEGVWKLSMIPETIFGYFQEDDLSGLFNQMDVEVPYNSDNDSRRFDSTGAIENSNNSNPVQEPDPFPEPIVSIKIQTGSYLDRDNANSQIKDLNDAGFNAEIIQVIVNGNQYNRVMVTGINSLNVEKEIIKLKDAGFEGFPVY